MPKFAATAFAPIALFALTACVGGELAEMRAAAQREPDHYVCEADAKGEFGSIFYTLEVPIDGRTPFHRINWTSPDRARGARLHLQWVGEGAFDQEREAHADLWIWFETAPKVVDQARFEVRKGSNFSDLVFAGPFRFASPWPDKTSRFEFVGHWSDIRSWLGDSKMLLINLVKKDGTVLDRDVLHASTIAGLDRAISVARVSAESKAKDFRSYCHPAEPIIVT